MICEVAYKVGQGGSWQAGMPVEVRSPGVYVTSNEFTAWLAGTEPLGIPTLPVPTAARMRNWIQRLATLSDPGFVLSDVSASAGLEEEDVTRMRVDALATIDKVAGFGGCDTTWGLSEIRTLSVMIADLDMQQIEGLTRPVEHLPVGALEAEILHRRAYVIPYTTLLSPDTVDAVIDTAVTVIPARGETPFAFSQLVSEV